MEARCSEGGCPGEESSRFQRWGRRAWHRSCRPAGTEGHPREDALAHSWCTKGAYGSGA